MDKEYIEMCRSAEEIQEQWEPKSGDRITHWQEFAKKRVPAPIEILQKGKYDSLKDSTGYLRVSTNAVWLPRQEDLIKIYNDSDAVDLVIIFSEWVMKGGFIASEYKQFKDMTTLWLCFVMETCYGRRWDTETKKWVKI